MASLLELVSASVPLKRRGRDWWGKCPFHNEKTSSFKVGQRGGREVFHCFGCGADGDAIEWIRQTRKVGYKEALAILGEERPGPDPALIKRRETAAKRQQAIAHYRDRNPDCICPDWLIDAR